MSSLIVVRIERTKMMQTKIQKFGAWLMAMALAFAGAGAGLA